MSPWGPAALMGVVCLLGGLLVPLLIGRLPHLALGSALASGLVGAVLGLVLGWDWSLLVWVPLVPAGVALAVVDWRTRLLPTRIIAPLYVVTLLLVLLVWAITRDTDDLLRAGGGWLVAGGLFLVLWLVHPRGLGYGDVRLSGVLGLALGQLGWAEVVIGLYAGFLLGALGGGLLRLTGLARGVGFAFGPFMLLGAVAGVVLGGSGLL